ncbi:Com family DNA-binding transcriptional regulator [uncultured Desulfovibrio sp.]|uniref:Com family DNA-binding transcriptional regulator n=1 Tax=uncultured Desulfovibrio sp. TaxID=167968 RepID=UPI00262F2032|nr:Com family DNA-binding transcriptional regulator [uncultured Desulfovibrio sp.]
MQQDADNEIRCCHCRKLLAKGWARDAHLVHKCPRCGAYNILRATRPHSEPPDGHPEQSYDQGIAG